MLSRLVAISAFLSISIMTLASSAHAGHGAGSGDGIVVCTDPVTQKIKAEVLEIYEGRTKYGLTYSKIYSIDKNKIADFIKLALYSNKKIKALWKFGFKSMNDLLDAYQANPKSEGFSLEDIDYLTNIESGKLSPDLESELASGQIKLEPHCKLKQYMEFFDLDGKSSLHSWGGIDLKTSELYVNGFLMWFHEGLYFAARKKFAATNSRAVRRLLAYAASDQVHDHNRPFFFKEISNIQQKQFVRYSKQFARGKLE